jgi:hypothetical protein
MPPPPLLLRFKVLWPITSTDVYISAPTANSPNLRYVSVAFVVFSTDSALFTSHRPHQRNVQAKERVKSEAHNNSIALNNSLDRTEVDGKGAEADGKGPEANGERVEVDEKPDGGSRTSTPVNEAADSQLPSHSTKDDTPPHEE